MGMLITTAAEAKKLLSPEYFTTFCQENMISPNADLEEEIVAIDKMDLMGFGTTEESDHLIADVAEITGRTTSLSADYF